MVGSNAALAVGRTGQGHLGRHVHHEVFDLDGIADSADVGVAGLKMLIDPDPATRSDLQARINRQLVFRPDPDAENDQLSREPLA
jgi:hypothetical protein